ncbi:MAG: hypothetical protein ACRD2N_13640 [Vicinamibacterales bacterium]
MKKAIACAVMTVFAVGMSASTLAQDKPAAKEHTMTGCLQKGATADTFVVQNTAEKGPKMIGIVSSKANLAPHVSHKIDITGTAVPNKDAESMKPAPPKADHYMNLTAIKMVSATCP